MDRQRKYVNWKNSAKKGPWNCNFVKSSKVKEFMASGELLKHMVDQLKLMADQENEMDRAAQRQEVEKN